MYTDTTGSQASKQLSKQASKHTQTSERTARQTNKQPNKHTYTHNMHPFIPSMHTCFEIQRRKHMNACKHATCMSPLKLAFRSIAYMCRSVQRNAEHQSTKLWNHPNPTSRTRHMHPVGITHHHTSIQTWSDVSWNPRMGQTNCQPAQTYRAAACKDFSGDIRLH